MKLFLSLTILTTVTLAAEYKEVKEFDRVEIVEGHCQIRQATITLKDGVEISKTFHRWAVEPEGDLSLFDPRVKGICKAAWTPDVVQKFKDLKKANEQRFLTK